MKAVDVHQHPPERLYELLHRDASVEVYVVGWDALQDTGFTTTAR